ncbi:hypothetical protein PVAG01_02691 [Phlyctema vagabunda]|uniref:F-box domain-containing protein n=1 Tax=Phlyctema vagabunda TaxID=108571 RepID=A0ABR4PRL2_9HELO
MDYIMRLLEILWHESPQFLRLSPLGDTPKDTPEDALAPSQSPMTKLPAELLLEISDCLPTASAATFSLTCQAIYRTVGDRYIEKLTTPEDVEFFELLERDLPGHITCVSCRRLHRIEVTNNYTWSKRSPWTPKPDCAYQDCARRTGLYIHEHFSSTIFKMAMKQHRLFGHDDVKSRQLLSLLSIQSPRTLERREIGESTSVDCSIERGSLFTRQRVIFHNLFEEFVRGFIAMRICPHVNSLFVEQPLGIRLRVENENPRPPMSFSSLSLML